MERYLYDDLNRFETSHWWHISKRKTVRLLINKFLTLKNPRILDIGCGTGQNLYELKKLGDAWGVDKSSKAVIFCKKRGIKKVKVGTCYNTSFKDSFFDVITLLDVLEHTNDQKTLKEISRVLKPGGLLVITVPAFNWLWSRWDEVLHHKRRYTKQSLERLLKKNHFLVKKISYRYMYLVLPALLVRTIKARLFKKHYPSDFQLSPPVLNYILLKIADLERHLFDIASLPIGTSLVCIAQKQ